MPNQGPIRMLVALSDIHAGGTTSLLPPGFVLTEGNPIRQNAIQEWLWQCWEDSQRWLAQVAGDSPYGLILNGDIVEGVHHGTKQIIANELRDHIQCAHAILDPVVEKASKVFMVKGTESHTGNCEIDIARHVGAEVNPETGLPIFDRLTIDIAGVRLVARHHIPTAVRSYLEASQFSIQLGVEQQEAIRNNEKPPRILLCAHRHRYGEFKDGFGLCIVSPPWQALTRYGHKVVPQARTKPGMFILDWRGIPDGELPVVHHRLYDAPQPKAISL